MRISGVIAESIVDGPGIRVTVFFQGCLHACPGCHNPATHDMKGGMVKSISEVMKVIEENPYTDGVTLSGGDPLYQIDDALELVKSIKKRFGLNIVVYTGFTYEEIIQMGQTNGAYLEFFSYIDTLIDGPFVMKLKDLSLQFCGSSNQRIIDIPASIDAKKIIKRDLLTFD